MRAPRRCLDSLFTTTVVNRAWPPRSSIACAKSASATTRPSSTSRSSSVTRRRATSWRAARASRARRSTRCSARLQEKDLVFVTDGGGRAKRYVPVDLEEFIDRYRTRVDRALDGLRDELESIGADEPVGYIWNVHGRAPLLERTTHLVERAEQTLLISGWDEELGELATAIAAAHRRKVQVAVIDYGTLPLEAAAVYPAPDQGHHPRRERRSRPHALRRRARRAHGPRPGRRRRARRLESEPRLRGGGRGLPEARHLRAEDRRPLSRSPGPHLRAEFQPLARRLLRSRARSAPIAPGATPKARRRS